jgi:UDP-N-acetylglucosamine/UDP-N-acetylgalactosamine 4-epimerase
MSDTPAVLDAIRATPRVWAVTGAAGFIGSNLVEHLLRLGQTVIGIDNFLTGSPANVRQVRDAAGAAGERYHFVEADLRSLEECRGALAGADVVIHQAALGSVPRSIEDPIATNENNVDGFLNVLVAAKDRGIRRVVYASSSSVYGDEPTLPKVEERVGRPLSPYAVSKAANELYAAAFASAYGMELVGLRYFNVFGPRQDPNGPYAAVIPQWIAALLEGRPCFINGDGETSRDFCYVENVVQANLRAAVVEPTEACGRVYNIAVGDRTTLNELFRTIRDGLAVTRPEIGQAEPVYREFRAGDIRHSLADISLARRLLGYDPEWRVGEGMRETLRWYVV